MEDGLKKHSQHLEELVVERSEKLKNAERLAAIGATAGMVGHDIRNPLTAITGAVYIAKNKLKDIPDGEAKDGVKKNLELISEQTLYVNKIVGYFKITRGRSIQVWKKRILIELCSRSFPP